MDVDIISMSLASYEQDERVESAVRKAHMDGRVLLCSAHDEGLNIDHAYPACMRETITFAASNQVGKVKQNMGDDPDSYDFRIHATNIFAGFVPFLRFDQNVSGSSVATAIGAGLSSLMIACHHLANNNRPKKVKGWQKSIVSDRLEAMASKPGSRYIRLEKFCDIDKQLRDRKVLDIAGILKTCFEVKEPKDLGSYK
jgi:hypothetical protein